MNSVTVTSDTLWPVHTPTFLYTAVHDLLYTYIPTTVSLLLNTASSSSLGGSPTSIFFEIVVAQMSISHV